MLALFADPQLLPLLGEHAKVIAVSDQKGPLARGVSTERQTAIDALISHEAKAIAAKAIAKRL